MSEDPLQDERLRLREDAKRLLRVSYEQRTAQGEVGLRVDLGAGAEELGLSTDSPHLASLVDYMEVAGWIKLDPGAFDFVEPHSHDHQARGGGAAGGMSFS